MNNPSCKSRRRKSTHRFLKRYYYKLKWSYPGTYCEHIDCAHEFRKGTRKSHSFNPPFDIEPLLITREEWKTYQTLLGFKPYVGLRGRSYKFLNLMRRPNDNPKL